MGIQNLNNKDETKRVLVIVGQMPTTCKSAIPLAQVHGMHATHNLLLEIHRY